MKHNGTVVLEAKGGTHKVVAFLVLLEIVAFLPDLLSTIDTMKLDKHKG